MKTGLANLEKTCPTIQNPLPQVTSASARTVVSGGFRKWTMVKKKVTKNRPLEV